MAQTSAQSIASIKSITIVAIFIAISFIGSLIKLPSPFGTIALDSCPAFTAAILVSPLAGAFVGFLGHLLTSMSAGFPFTILIHLIIALQMAAVSLITGYVGRKGHLVICLLLGTFLNGVIAPAMLIPFFGVPFFVGMVVPLTLGSFTNFVLTGLVVKALKGKVHV